MTDPFDPNRIDVAVYRGQLTHDLGNALHSGAHGLDVIPGLLHAALELEAWRERTVIETGEHIDGFTSFEEYVTASPPKGLGSSMPVIQRLLAIDEDSLVNLRTVTKGKVGRPAKTADKTTYIISSLEYGTSKAYLLERLKGERPDLYAQVQAKTKSAHKAAIEAGFIKRSLNISNPDDVDSIARTLRKNLDARQIDELVRLLTDTHN